MNFRRNISRLAVIGILAIAVSGPAMATDRKTTNTLLGAGLGAAAGAVLSQGDPLLTIGGAAAGGILGNVLTEDRRQQKWNRSGNYQRSDRRYVQQRHYRERDNRRHHRHR
ncbi:hypothetical protein [Candidimonas sp. SYP-B2681]|uniref:hypothetical protein n=1 Tax=Candidimonas sp. SYP-B2681 TaxID=2497686 RepID=UPI0018F4EA30|nr:hypothetical protein [Candidimonas sp. SYP-B2681]